MKQEKLRNDILKIRERYGTPYAFIARNVGVSKEMINMFANGKANLSQELYQKLENYINMLLWD